MYVQRDSIICFMQFPIYFSNGCRPQEKERCKRDKREKETRYKRKEEQKSLYDNITLIEMITFFLFKTLLNAPYTLLSDNGERRRRVH